ncbi:MAG: hypothetical protein MJZ60_00685 [Bacteroidaceae bacterium]|nr:hypothetical protein [Bacteroidaceae bacterium]
MKLPLMLKVYRTLRKGWQKLTPEAQQALRAFVMSQKSAGGYLNAGGKEDEYYTQFGGVLEAVISPSPTKLMHGLSLGVKEHTRKSDVYGVFFQFLTDEWRPWRRLNGKADEPMSMMTNATCCKLAMQYQMGEVCDSRLVEWLVQRQDETGGFYASEVAPIPDMLSTAVALFTLQLIGEKPHYVASDFIEAHWLENGSFAPTVFDEYSDVEYAFYGLLALGAKAPLTLEGE